MNVREYIETVPMYGQQVIKITNEDEDDLIIFEYRQIPELRRALDLYGDEEIVHVSSDVTEIEEQDESCILITIETKIEEDDSCSCGGCTCGA